MRATQPDSSELRPWRLASRSPRGVRSVWDISQPIGNEISQATLQAGPLAAVRFGPQSEASQPVAIAVHGITGNAIAWRAVARALGDRASLIAIDLRGRGDSSGLPGPYGIAVHVTDLLAVLDALGLARSLLVGHSLGAYIAARFAVEHPDRVAGLVLLDGGLPIPGSEGADPQQFADAFLGPALARLQMRFPSREQYLDWWRQHPAIAAGDIDEHDLRAYVEHDSAGQEPEIRSKVNEDAVRSDAAELAELGASAYELSVPARLLCAPRGLLDDPHPMQPLALARDWAAEDRDRREAMLVSDVNHYSIVMGARGAAVVADTIAATLA